MLVIVDQCENLNTSQQEGLKNFVNSFLDNTEHSNIILITEKQDQIPKFPEIKEIEIKKLKNVHAGKLLDIIAGDNLDAKYLINGGILLKNHPILKLMDFNTANIISIGSLIRKDQTLDEFHKEMKKSIEEEKKQAKEQEAENKL